MGLIGRKVGMTQVFEESGDRVPVTAVQVLPNVVVALRSKEKNGYTAVQIGAIEAKSIHVNKPTAGSFKKAGVKPVRELKEFRVGDDILANFEVGKEIKVQDIFAKGLAVDVTGRSKGKGFQGVMKRHNMSGAQTVTHGTHEFFRHGGSIGCRLTPGRVHKGKRMGGHMGDENVTVQNLEVVDVLPEQNVILIRGAVPGAKNGTVVVQQAVKKEFYKRRGLGLPEARSKNPLKASKRGGA